ncbi:MAG TPA: hypothetical protein VGQ30_00325 [Gemmatimonadaceae bacterium]|jgi:hypothetical protein|nr:hypothetical protein [Gemmatimonadaceae bacterium]
MRTLNRLALALAGIAFVASSGSAQIQNVRPADSRGINVFENPKNDTTPFKKVTVGFGGAFEQDFQNLTHTNTSTPVLVAGVNKNALMPIGPGFTTAMANLDMNVQLAEGIRVNLVTYLSTRHHNDTWVKGGYLSIDASPWDIPVLNDVMKYTTLKIGQFDVDFGDAHYRRTDAGNGMYNPFIGNLIMDAFSTEIGATAYFRRDGFILAGGITQGTSDGQVQAPGQHQPAYLAKIGFDKQLSENLRVRLTGGMYTDAKATSNVLYNGDRGGSHYFDVMENTASSETSNAWSGNLQPGFSNRVASYVVNPFVKCHGFEFFGNFETSTGGAVTEATDRTWRQNSGDFIYRFLPEEKAYVAYRYNKAVGQLVGNPVDVNIVRTQFAAGLFLTKNVLTKIEYINQDYNKFLATDIRNGGNFKGVMISGVVAF